MNYGLTYNDLKFARQKLDTQKKYLEDNSFTTSSGQVKSLLEVSFSANISERYYAQLSNKINTMHSLAISQNLKPLFLTITLDGFFRGFLAANYSKWDKQTDEQKEAYFRHIPNNEVYGLLRDKIKNKEQFNPKDLYNILCFQWYRFSAGYAFKHLKKSSRPYIYLKSTEPHKDGVPHMHILFWVPEDSFSLFQKDFVRYFPAPQNHKPLKNSSNGDTKGFQTAINNPVGYIMKYTTKSFMDLRTGEDMNFLQAWYVKNKIRRITTSHSTIPQWVYQKVFAFEQDWYHLTDLTIREPRLCEWSKEDDYFILIEDNGRCLEYDSGLLTLKHIDSNNIIKQIGEHSKKSKVIKSKFESTPTKWINFKKTKPNLHEVWIDDKLYIYRDKKLSIPTPKPLIMKNYELLTYWQNLDIESVNPHHFAHTHNVMIERGLMDGFKIPINHNVEQEMWGFDSLDLESEVF